VTLVVGHERTLPTPTRRTERRIDPLAGFGESPALVRTSTERRALCAPNYFDLKNSTER